MSWGEFLNTLKVAANKRHGNFVRKSTKLTPSSLLHELIFARLLCHTRTFFLSNVHGQLSCSPTAYVRREWACGIDAGSSGSRLYIFNWPTRTNSQVPQVTEVTTSKSSTRT